MRAVPCIRNMLDMRSNSKLATVWTKASELVSLRGAHRTGGKHTYLSLRSANSVCSCCTGTEGAYRR